MKVVIEISENEYKVLKLYKKDIGFFLYDVIYRIICAYKNALFVIEAQKDSDI